VDTSNKRNQQFLSSWHIKNSKTFRNFSIDNKNELLYIIKRDKHLMKYFFDKIPFTEVILQWVEEIVKEGFLDPKNNPAPIEDKKDVGYFSIPVWDAMATLKTAFFRSNKSPKWYKVRKIIDEFHIY
jgi:hypothetical protein